MTPRQRGLAIAVLAVAILLPDTLLYRLIGADEWTIMVWRAGFQGAVLWAGLAVLHRGRVPVGQLGRVGLAFAATMGVANVCFTLAVSWTTVANTLFVIALTPLWAALISWLLLGERLSPRVVLTILTALIGVGLLLSGEDTGGVAHWSGNLAAFGCSLCMGLGFTLARLGAGRPMVAGLALSTVVPVLFGAAMGGAVLPTLTDLPLLLGMGAFIAPVSFALLTLAARDLPSAEVSLILLLETALGPVLVWWVVGEDPGDRAVLGGGIVVAALVVSNLVALRRAKGVSRVPES
ncbi:DMT family transporter [Roseobacter sp. HKCCA0434]|uniref:DMT family transporter n=1 Tax=Roseobacter sp. HKCCA0434 TaxID=3079297 RepID=UPI002905B62C|nr:DMT family transporter [Roseobacter sp. HKCCA0434]